LAGPRREAHPETLGRLLGEATLLHERPSGLGIGRTAQEVGVELPREPVRLEQAVALVGVAARSGGRPLLVPERDAVLARETLDGLDEGQPLDLHQEAIHVPAGTTAEAVVRADRRAHVERRGLLVVERTQALSGATTG